MIVPLHQHPQLPDHLVCSDGSVVHAKDAMDHLHAHLDRHLFFVGKQLRRTDGADRAGDPVNASGQGVGACFFMNRPAA